MSDRRTRPRVPVEKFVKNVFDDDPLIGNGVIFRFVKNLCAEGLFVADPLRSLEDQMRLELSAMDGGEPLEVEAEVVWRTEDGAGVRFRSITGEARERLDRVCKARRC